MPVAALPPARHISLGRPPRYAYSCPVRALGLLLCLASGTFLAQQQAPSPAATSQQAALTQALLGRWTGVLEYRDYSEPPTSNKRVELPTWLTIRSAPEGLLLDYTYDDGPAKTVFSHSALAVNLESRTYKVLGTDAVTESYTVTNPEVLKEGHGTLALIGTGMDNDKPAEIRTTWTIRRNLLSWLEEVRPAGSTAPFSFRHRYLFTRAEAPPSSAPLPK